jgi:hypothetical protein
MQGRAHGNVTQSSMKVAGTSPAEGENSVSPEKERILWEISNWLERQLSLSPSLSLRQQWLAVAVAVVVTVAAVGCTAEAAAASTAAVWGVAASTALAWAAAASEVLRLAAGFAVRRLALVALTVATTLPGVAADDLPVAVATGTVEA